MVLAAITRQSSDDRSVLERSRFLLGRAGWLPIGVAVASALVFLISSGSEPSGTLLVVAGR